MPVGQVGAHGLVQGVAVKCLKDAPESDRLGAAPPAEQVTAYPEGCQQRVRGPLAELGEFIDALRAADGRASTHQQDRRQRVPPAPA
ncbi:hypothetical protein GCM10010389_16860 [Streptomyces echinoruber]|uniref:Uncharacterized protein n=1 Tax=Streptomyces echinoruber TaxID=68898 RepID=A0A918R0U8_9ACTN|nr:hypothetical protein GCM10010389_16860 [Streptomyces echinoruber]